MFHNKNIKDELANALTALLYRLGTEEIEDEKASALLDALNGVEAIENVLLAPVLHSRPSSPGDAGNRERSRRKSSNSTVSPPASGRNADAVEQLAVLEARRASILHADGPIPTRSKVLFELDSEIEKIKERLRSAGYVR